MEAATGNYSFWLIGPRARQHWDYWTIWQVRKLEAQSDLAKDTEWARVVETPLPSSKQPPNCFSSVWTHLVDLSDNSIHNLPFKGPEDNGLVLNRIKNKSSAWLDHTSTNVVNGGDSDYKAIPVRKGKRKALCGQEPLKPSATRRWAWGLGDSTHGRRWHPCPQNLMPERRHNTNQYLQCQTLLS